ncbi:MAG: GNAT family N-acetyltransferase [Brachymonas sp.]|nr:GNAT family N-acetyltransferase [Brachymonas sp.]
MPTPSPRFICKAFDELTLRELQALHVLRQQVFVVEQNCAYQDADDTDLISWHLFALDDAGRALATCRLIPAGHKYTEAAIGRLANAAQARGTGMGRAIMEAAIAELAQRSPGPIRISAQQYLQRFYESLGFEVVGAPYLEDDIPHLEMLRAGATQNHPGVVGAPCRTASTVCGAPPSQSGFA